MKKAAKSITLDPEILEKGKRLAKEQDRTFSNYVNNLIKDQEENKDLL